MIKQTLLDWCKENNREDMLDEQDYANNGDLSPSNTSSGSARIIQWKCKKNHSWNMRPTDRTHQNQNCPYCSGRRLCSGYNDLATKYPEIAAEQDYENNDGLTPSDVLPAVDKIVQWKCKNGHSYNISLQDRTTRKRGCPYCSGRRPRLLKGFNDLQTKYPELAAEQDYEKNNGLTPSDVMPGTDKKVQQVCRKRHSYKMAPSRRVYSNGYCTECTKHFHSSFPEKAIYYFIKSVDESAVESFKDKENGITELDIYIPKLQIGIEYDGMRQHGEKRVKNDSRKSLNCQKAGIKLYRIREEGCADLPVETDRIFIRENLESFDSLNQIIKDFIFEIYQVEIDVDIEKHRSEIYDLLFG